MDTSDNQHIHKRTAQIVSKKLNDLLRDDSYEYLRQGPNEFMVPTNEGTFLVTIEKYGS